MKQYDSKAKPAQSCLMAMISVNQLRREFQVFQNDIMEQLSMLQQHSMKDIIALWRLINGRVQSKKAYSKQRNKQELKVAIQVLNQKQEYIVQLQNKIVEAEQSKQQLLNILQKQTELCSQIRQQQQVQVANFNKKIQQLQHTIQQKQVSMDQLNIQTTVLKRLLKQQYQHNQNSIQPFHYFTNNPNRRQFSQIQNSQRLSKHRNSQIQFTKQGTMKRVFHSKDLKSQRSFKQSKLLKTPRRNESSNSTKSQIQKIIQRAVKQNYNKYKH